MGSSVANDLDAMFTSTRARGRAALIPYITAGFPDPDGYVDLAVLVLEAGADALEIGIPFSDPLLDGPATQRSQQVALEAGMTPAHCLAFAAEIHARSQKPLLFMGAYNPILAYGPERFCQDAAAAGVSGLILPDLPYEEQEEIREAARAHDLHLIQLVAPTSTAERLQRVCEAASGLIYGISIAGVTGPRASVRATAEPLVERVRACTEVPIAVGFGIAGPEAAREVAEFADGVVVGSAMINVLAEASPAEAEKAGCEFVSALRAAVDRAPRM